jgi:hypothetical protein
MLFIGASSPDRNARFSALGTTQPVAGVCSLEKKKKGITDQPEVAIDRELGSSRLVNSWEGFL